MGFSQQWIIWHWCCRKWGWAHLGVPAPAELQDHDLQGQTAMGKSNVCKYSVPEGPHQQEKQPPALSLSLDWLHSFWEQNIGNTPTAPGFGKFPFPISNSHSQFQIPNCLTGHLLPTIFGSRNILKTIQKHYQLLQLSLPFCRKSQNCENYTSWKI